MTPTSSAQAEPKPIRTTKSGIELESFSDVSLYKTVPAVPPVTNVQDALARLGNDHAKLLTIIQSGLQAEAVEQARNSDDGWLQIDENGKDTTEVFTGTLISSEVLNPMVLTLSRYNAVEVLRGDKKVEITWDEAANREEKRAVKAATIESIRTSPKLVESLKRKMANSAAE